MRICMFSTAMGPVATFAAPWKKATLCTFKVSVPNYED